MFKLFKKQDRQKSVVEAVVAIAEPQPQKSVQDMVAEIHETFYTEVDRLEAEAMQYHKVVFENPELIDKAERLQRLGFERTKEIKIGSEERKRMNELLYANQHKKDLIDAIMYFGKYPNYKFITEASVKKICEKYGLTYGTVDRYIGTVPDENLEKMEQFKIEQEDECYEKYYVSSRRNRHFERYISFKAQQEIVQSENERTVLFDQGFFGCEKCKLVIAAPEKDFDMRDHRTEGSKIVKMEIPDPIVLAPVYFKGNKHYLIVTAWGPEANDSLVVNHKMN